MHEENIEKMNFKELRAEVQLLRDEIALLRRKFYQELQLLDSSNFSKGFTVEQDNMKAQVQVTADAIKTLVSETDLKKTLSAYSTIKQTARAIEAVVSKSASLSDAEAVTSIDEMLDTDKVYVIRTTDESDDEKVLSEKYYYYNDLSNEWELLSGDSIYTVFEQTAEGFALRGNVVVDGKTVITKDLILKSLAWYTAMSGDKLVICDGDKNVKLEFGANTVSDAYEYPYIFIGAGESDTKKGCIEKMRKGLWIGDSSVFNYEGEYPGGSIVPVDGAETVLGTGIFFDFENSNVFLYQGGKISLLSGGSSVAVFG